MNLLLANQDENEKLLNEIKKIDSREKFFRNTKSQSFEELTETSKQNNVNRAKKNEEPPIRLIDDEEEDSNRNTDLIDLTKTLKSIKKSNNLAPNPSTGKKQLQFNFEHKKEENVKRNSSNLLDALNQIKSAELNKRRASTLLNLTKSKRKKSSHFNFKNLEAINVEWQKSVYNLLERPSGTKGFIYRIYIFTIILGSILTGALNTLESMSKWSYDMFFWYEFAVTLYFAIEYVLRVWSSGIELLCTTIAFN
jgi:hypothetical protein